MGCITSRGYPWPPRPYKRFLPISRAVQLADGRILVEEVYTLEYPGRQYGGGRTPATRWDEEASPGQEAAIRHLEDG